MADGKKPLILTWWPIIAVVMMGIAASAVDGYRLNAAEKTMDDIPNVYVKKDTYALELAANEERLDEMDQSIKDLKAQDKINREIRLHQEYIKKDVESNNKKLEDIDKKIDRNFDEMMQMLKQNQSSGL